MGNLGGLRVSSGGETQGGWPAWMTLPNSPRARRESGWVSGVPSFLYESAPPLEDSGDNCWKAGSRGWAMTDVAGCPGRVLVWGGSSESTIMLVKNGNLIQPGRR